MQVVFGKIEYKNVRVKWNSIAITDNDRVFFDNAGKKVPAGKYFGHESESGTDADLVDKGAVTVEYASKIGEVLHAQVEEDNFTVKRTPANGWSFEKSGAGLGNSGIGFTFKLKNNNSYAGEVKEIKPIGKSWCISAMNEESISSDTESALEYEAQYITDRAKAKELCVNLYNYYQYSNIDLTLYSYTDFPLGSFVRISEDGIGTLYARILQKQYGFDGLILYTLEAISDFSAGSINFERHIIRNNESIRGGGVTAEAATDEEGNITGGNITAEGDLDVDGDISTAGNVSAEGDLTVGGALKVLGGASISENFSYNMNSKTSGDYQGRAQLARNSTP